MQVEDTAHCRRENHHAEEIRRPSRLLLRDLQPRGLARRRARSTISCRTTIPIRPRSASSAACISRPPPFAQDKLVRVARGRDSRRRGRSRGAARRPSAGMSRSNCRPTTGGSCSCRSASRMGSARSSPIREVLYKVTNFYSAAHDHGLAFDDPALGIDWRVDSRKAVLSDKDRKHPRLAELGPMFD